MEVKRYYVKNMQEGMSLIRKDLGSDAVILSQRPYRGKGFLGLLRRPLLEVMVAYETRQNRPAASAYHKQDGPISPPVYVTENRIKELDNHINTLSGLMNDFMNRFKHVKNSAAADYDENVEAMARSMSLNEVSEDLIHKLAGETQEIVDGKGADPREVMEQLISGIIGEPAPIKIKKFQRTVVLFLGSTGVGKTTSLVKLAAHYVVKEKLKVGLINSDIYRIAAQEHLRTYAEILQVPIQVIYNLGELPQAMTEFEDRDVVFIDTVGKSPKDLEYRDHIKKLIKLSAADEIILAISAPTGISSCKEVINHYSFIEDYKLLITKTDETDLSGVILNACYFSGRPIAYLTNGQTVPDDIEVMDQQDIIGRLLR